MELNAYPGGLPVFLALWFVLGLVLMVWFDPRE
jgi:hypothetical protein